MGAGYVKTIINMMVSEQCHVLDLFCFLLFLGWFSTLLLMISEALGQHFGCQKVDANFD